MNDPKYKFGDTDVLRHRSGEYDIAPDEPVMVLRGKDVTALHAVTAYVRVLLAMEPSDVVDSHLDSSIERLRTFYLYQTATPSVAGVGCSQKHHSGSEKLLEDAYKLLVELRCVAPQEGS